MSTAGVGLAASFTCSKVLTEAIEFWLQRLTIEAPLQVAGYSQILNELHTPSAFRNTLANLVVVHLPDLVHTRGEQGLHENVTVERGNDLEEHAKLLCQSLFTSLHAQQHRPLVLIICPWKGGPLASSCAKAAQHFASAFESTWPVHVVLPAELEALADGAEIFDDVADRLGHIPFTNEMQCAIATAAARRLNAELGAPIIKVIAVDCDNTLWSNEVSEVGPSGLRLEAHHLALHQRLLSHAKAGVILCLCSRNEGALVTAALEHLEQHGLQLKMGRDILNTLVGVSPLGSKAHSLRRLAVLNLLALLVQRYKF